MTDVFDDDNRMVEDFSPENYTSALNKMNPEIKEIWLNKLENENIPQTTSRLGTTDGERCCLGVLCDIAVEQGIIPTPVASYPTDDNSTLVYGEGEGSEQAVLPKVVAEWSGVNPRGDFNVNNLGVPKDALSSLNDSGATFPQIAAIIREHF